MVATTRCGGDVGRCGGDDGRCGGPGAGGGDAVGWRGTAGPDVVARAAAVVLSSGSTANGEVGPKSSATSLYTPTERRDAAILGHVGPCPGQVQRGVGLMEVQLEYPQTDKTAPKPNPPSPHTPTRTHTHAHAYIHTYTFHSILQTHSAGGHSVHLGEVSAKGCCAEIAPQPTGKGRTRRTRKRCPRRSAHGPLEGWWGGAARACAHGVRTYGSP